jgi:hypothetical protein
MPAAVADEIGYKLLNAPARDIAAVAILSKGAESLSNTTTYVAGNRLSFAIPFVVRDSLDVIIDLVDIATVIAQTAALAVDAHELVNNIGIGDAGEIGFVLFDGFGQVNSVARGDAALEVGQVNNVARGDAALEVESVVFDGVDACSI